MTMLRRLSLPAMLLCLCVPMASCLTVHATQTSATNPVCLATKPLTFSKNDTAETKEEVRQINAVLRSLCSFGKPAGHP